MESQRSQGIEHKAQLVASKTLEDGSIAFCYGCCDDPGTYSWQSFSNHHTMTDEYIDLCLRQHAVNVEARHHHKTRHNAALDQIETMTIELPSGTHIVTLDEHAHHHDEGVKIDLLCCGDLHGKTFIIEHLQQYTPKELTAKVHELAEELANDHAHRANAARLNAAAQVKVQELIQRKS